MQMIPSTRAGSAADVEWLAWQQDDPQIALETHIDWTDAVAFYRALGYGEPRPH
jgi:hypothetical protein